MPMLPGIPPACSAVPAGAFVYAPGTEHAASGSIADRCAPPPHADRRNEYSKKRPLGDSEGAFGSGSADDHAPKKAKGGKAAMRAPYNCKKCGQPAKGHVCPNKDLPGPPSKPKRNPSVPPCPHGGPGGVYARLRNCLECRAEVCEHNRRKLMCRFCTPENTAICIHNRDKGICKECGNATRRCEHDRIRAICKVPSLHDHEQFLAHIFKISPSLMWRVTLDVAGRNAGKDPSACTSARRHTVKTVAAPKSAR